MIFILEMIVERKKVQERSLELTTKDCVFVASRQKKKMM